MRRNQVVYEREPNGAHWSPYGRVNRVNKDGTVQVIYCTKQIMIQRPEDLIVVDNYKGYTDYGSRYHYTDEELLQFSGSTFRKKPIFRRMPTLRRLKQWARRYAPDADI